MKYIVVYLDRCSGNCLGQFPLGLRESEQKRIEFICDSPSDIFSRAEALIRHAKKFNCEHYKIIGIYVKMD